MSDGGRARVWVMGEAAAIAAAVAVSVWALRGVDHQDAGAIVASQSVEPTGVQPEHTAPGAAAGDEGSRSIAEVIWPVEKRTEPVEAEEAAKVAVPPPLELLGIVTSREGRPIGAMMYDGRTDETMVLEVGGEREGIRMLAIEAAGVRIAFDGADFEFKLARGS